MVAGSNGDVGCKVATRVVALYVTVAASAVVVPCFTRLKAPEMVVAFIAVEKVAVTAEVRAIPLAPLDGVKLVTVGPVPLVVVKVASGDRLSTPEALRLSTR